MKILRRIGIILLFIAGCAACDYDLFGTDRQPLVGPYGIFIGEGKFYLVLDRFEDGCGLLGEAIYQVGWNDKLILAQLEPCGGRVGPPSGWRLVHVETRKIETITEHEVKIKPELVGIKLVRAQEAWAGRYGKRR